MSFIRIKKIDSKEYAYLVENKWYKRKVKGKGKGPRQKVSKYLGRVHEPDKTDNTNFFNFKKIDNLDDYLKNNRKNEIIKDLVEWELFRHNINKEEFTIDFNNKKVIKDNKEVSLKMNEGFLNSYTLSRVFNLNSGSSYFLAKCFVDAGVEIPKEVFVGVFGK
ncbi:MAG: hypothetical protein V1831_03015 [Candidatus Woesearchaeota archaeon]